MEESKEDLKSKNSKKTRTHIPVDGYKIEQLRELPIETLIDIANDLDVENPQELKRQDLMFMILASQIDAGGFILFTGILEIKDGGFGFFSVSDCISSKYGNSLFVSLFLLA
jgi:transcription termination factor Rho